MGTSVVKQRKCYFVCHVTTLEVLWRRAAQQIIITFDDTLVVGLHKTISLVFVQV